MPLVINETNRVFTRHKGSMSYAFPSGLMTDILSHTKVTAVRKQKQKQKQRTASLFLELSLSANQRHWVKFYTIDLILLRDMQHTTSSTRTDHYKKNSLRLKVRQAGIIRGLTQVSWNLPKNTIQEDMVRISVNLHPSLLIRTVRFHTLPALAYFPSNKEHNSTVPKSFKNLILNLSVILIVF